MSKALGDAQAKGFGLPTGMRVLQRSGWTTLNQLERGDEVVDVDGRPCRVRRVVPCGVGPAVELRLRDGTVLTTGVHQLLPVLLGPERLPMMCSARRIEELLYQRTTVRLASCQPVDMPGITELPVDPYVLGLLLGDGCVTTDTVILWTTEEYLVRKFEERLPAGSRLSDHPRRQPRCTGWAVVGEHRGPGRNPLLQSLRQLGLAGVKAEQKFIPRAYRWADTTSRLALLQSLCDSDAGIDNWGRIRFSSASETLAEHVAFLVRSLGGRVTTHRRTASYGAAGQPGSKPAKDSFKVDIKLPDLGAFTLPRKAERLRPSVLAPQWSVAAVRDAGVAPLMSIETDSPAGTIIVSEGFVPVASAESLAVASALAA